MNASNGAPGLVVFVDDAIDVLMLLLLLLMLLLLRGWIGLLSVFWWI
jgi:hypothetical protein